MNENPHRSPAEDARDRRHDAGALTDGEVGAALREREARLREFVVSHPLPVLLGAVAAGFALARVMRLMREDEW